MTAAPDYFLADDLSGALDAAAAFHHAGRGVTVLLRPDAWPEVDHGDVIGLTTETRNAPPVVAADVVSRVLGVSSAKGARLRYKKIDSTLRGPIAAELAVVLAARPELRVLLAPANPRVGRTVRGGVLYVNGVPVAETAFGRDPNWPLRTSVVREVIAGLPQDRIVAPDCANEEDLRAAVREMETHGGEWLPVGSGGLIAALWAASAATRPQPPTEPGTSRALNGPVLLLGGSAQPLNRAQAALVAREGAGVGGLGRTESGCPVVHEVAFGEPARAGRAAAEALQRHGVGALLLPATRIEPARALAAMVTAAEAAVAGSGVRRIFMTGGETAFAICARLGVSALRYREELEPGLCVATAEAETGPLWLAVKPGGFGDERTWVRAWRALAACG